MIDGIDYEFSAEMASRHLDMSWAQEAGLTGERATLAVVTFRKEGERCWGGLKIRTEDEQGLVETVNYDWPDSDKVCMDALAELLKAQTLERLIAPLKAERERRGLSQREVGELMGLASAGAQGAIGRWELGTREPSASNLAAWADALGMKLAVVPKK